MPPKDWMLIVEDILEAVSRIRRYTEVMTFDDFSADDKTIATVVRNVTIIAEAARHIPHDVQERHPEMPWEKMLELRGAVVRKDSGARLSAVWDAAKRDIPPLEPLLKSVLESEL